jgi:hypothetical protein
MTTPEPDDDFLDTAAAAELLHVAPATLNAWRAAGRGPPVYRFSRRACLYRRADLLQFINQCRDDHQ